MIMEVLFATTNPAKVKWLSQRLEKYGVKIVQYPLEIPESRDSDVESVAVKKAKYAFERIKQPLIAEDRGFYIKALNGFPGTFVNFMHQTIGVSGVMKLMEQEEDRDSQFDLVLAYIDSNGVKTFKSSVKGKILDKIRNGENQGWGDVMKIFAYEKIPGKALSELSKKEWEEYQKLVTENDYMQLFGEWIEKYH